MRRGRLELGPAVLAVLLPEPQLTHLRCACFEELLAVTVVDVLVLADDEPGQRLLDQRTSCHAQKVGGGEVGLDDQPLLAEREVAHRRQIVQIEIPRPRGLQLHLGPAQFLVLHLQLNLVHPEIVQQRPRRVRRQRLQALWGRRGVFSSDLLRPVPQIVRLVRTGLFLSHGRVRLVYVSRAQLPFSGRHCVHLSARVHQCGGGHPHLRGASVFGDPLRAVRLYDRGLADPLHCSQLILAPVLRNQLADVHR